jgi:hypothetical protein
MKVELTLYLPGSLIYGFLLSSYACSKLQGPWVCRTPMAGPALGWARCDADIVYELFSLNQAVEDNVDGVCACRIPMLITHATVTGVGGVTTGSVTQLP